MVMSNNNSTAMIGEAESEAEIVWLASYPKSGNTWFRAFLSNLLYGSARPVNIDELGIPWGVSRCQFDRLCGLDSSLLLSEEINALWPAVLMQLSRELAGSPGARLLKTHGAYQPPNGNHFFKATSIDRVLYLVRNPLDVCISFAHHSSWTIDQSIDVMRDETYTFFQGNNFWNPSFREQVSSWSGNVKSWMNVRDFPVLVLRYEDLWSNPLTLFKKAVEFLKIDASQESIQQAVAFSDFKVLQEQEKLTGFREKSPKSSQFFRNGQAGNWRHVLSKIHIQKLLRDHGEVMVALDYDTDMARLK